MSLTIGARLGPYSIQEPLARGGMGEVYRAVDTRLDRAVAIKVLPAHLTGEGSRRQRFEREARAVAAASHPHICALFDVGSQDAMHFLVMEHLEGETLEQRLVRGSLPLDDVLRHAADIADALEHAHRLGIVHRDLKPANVMLTRSGAKLLDFGLAKLAPDDPVQLAPTQTGENDTETLTAEGTILGTVQYMAPEQVEGKEADARSDLFAFGAIVYEMATGRKAFTGNSRAGLIAAILTTEPTAMSALEPRIPAGLERLVKKCLVKDPEARWQTARDLLDEIRWIARAPSPAPAGSDAAPGISGQLHRRSRWARRDPFVAAAGLVLGAAIAGAGIWALLPSAPPLRPVRFTITPPVEFAVATSSGDRDVTISPDGTRLVYAIAGSAATAGLHLRAMDQLHSTPLSGTTGARSPFVSPDGQWIGFQVRSGAVRGLIKKVSATGGPPITVCQIEGSLRGASWGANDTIVFATDVRQTGLLKVSAAGGTPEVLTEPDPRLGELDHARPFVLPGARAVLYTIVAHGDALRNSRIGVLDLETRRQKTLIQGGSHAEYVAMSAESTLGYLVYAAAGALRAVRFDPVRLEVLGNPVPVVEEVLTKSNGTASFSVSHSGTLVYRAGPMSTAVEAQHTLVWVDRRGREEAVSAPPREYIYPRLSPDGTRIALDVRGQEFHIWIWDQGRRTMTRLTGDPEPDGYPAWTPDGRRVIFHSQRSGHQELYAQEADGTGGLLQLTRRSNPLAASSISPDGKLLVAMELTTDGYDLALLPLDGTGQIQPLIQTSFEEIYGEISPDGQWLAYQSNELGHNEVFVRPFPDVGRGRWQVSRGGGQHPLWARSGRELFYIAPSPSALMAVGIQSEASFSTANPVKLFDAPRYLTTGSGRSYDVTADGRRFLMIKQPVLDGIEPAPPITVVLNWTEELKNRVSGQ